MRGRRDARRRGPRWRRGCASRASSRSTTSTRARSSGGSATAACCAARSATRRSRSCTRARSPSRRSTAARSTAHVGTREPYVVGAGPRVVVVDLGCKRSIPRRLAAAGLEAHVVPGDWDADAILEREPRAVLVANGPGDPAVLEGPVETIRELLGRVPLFGICLGHQLLGLALGHETFKLPFGHRGANHPVRDLAHRPRARDRAEPRLRRRRGRATCQHVSLNDGTVRGARRRRLRERAVPPRGGARAARRPALLRPARRRVPKRTDLRSILIVGSGPIRIGQACEFDYSGAQACRVLRREGYRVVLVNSNPATIMTDPEWADATYLEPLDAETVARGDRARAARRAPADARRPDRAQPRRRADEAACSSVGVELIGADLGAIRRAEDRELFRDDGASRPGSPVPESIVVASRRRASDFPRAGDRAAGVHARRHRRRHRAHARGAAARGRARASPRARSARCSSSESLAGWQEHELEVMCDARRQLRRRLLDREPRPDGRPHRRLVDGRAAADAARRRVPAAARGGVRVRARRRRRDRRRERAVRVRAGDAASCA